ncbi:hypothetical protein MHU86_5080 [Fragilaria crotonensis]|nr:hypothetical protein MHU86_5080 [Fragilaria crotonensis]
MSRHFSHYPQCSVDIEGSRKRPASNHARRKKRRKRLQDTTADPTDIDSDGVDSDHHPRQLHHRRSSRRYVFPVSRNDSHGLTITTPEQHGEVTDWCGTASENPCEDFPVLDDEATPTVLGEVHQEDAPDSSIREYETTSSTEESEDEDAPDSSMLVAYQEHIDSVNDNGLNLSLFSREEKVQIDLLQTLSTLGAPMKAYEAIMQWTNRSVRSGHVFRDTAITSRKTVLSRVTKRLNRDRLIPVWETLYLPYSDVSVRVAYFSASALFADLLSCRHLNADTNYIFDGDWNPDHDPYAVPNGSVIGDLNTGRSYLKTPSSLCKNPHDMLIACPLAIDKTICDVGGSGRLPMEPITMQYGLMQHDVRKKPEAMCVLGYIHPLKKGSSASRTWCCCGTRPKCSSSHVQEMYQRNMES